MLCLFSANFNAYKVDHFGSMSSIGDTWSKEPPDNPGTPASELEWQPGREVAGTKQHCIPCGSIHSQNHLGTDNVDSNQPSTLSRPLSKLCHLYSNTFETPIVRRRCSQNPVLHYMLSTTYRAGRQYEQIKAQKEECKAAHRQINGLKEKMYKASWEVVHVDWCSSIGVHCRTAATGHRAAFSPAIPAWPVLTQSVPLVHVLHWNKDRWLCWAGGLAAGQTRYTVPQLSTQFIGWTQKSGRIPFMPFL